MFFFYETIQDFSICMFMTDAPSERGVFEYVEPYAIAVIVTDSF